MKMFPTILCSFILCLAGAPGLGATTETAASASKKPNKSDSTFKSPVEAGCETAAQALKVSPNDEKALAVFRKNINSPIAYDRAAAVVTLRKAGRNAKKLVPLLIAALTDESTTVRGEAATTLGGIGPDAKAAIPALKTASTSSHPPEQGAGCCMVRRDMWVQAAARKALTQITQLK